MNLPFQKENTWRKHCVYNHSNTYLFHFTCTYIQITLLSVDFAGDKNIAFNVSDAFLFGHPVYFDYQDFLSFASNFPFQVLMEENYEKCCNWIKSHNTLYDLITWSFFFGIFCSSVIYKTIIFHQFPPSNNRRHFYWLKNLHLLVTSFSIGAIL